MRELPSLGISNAGHCRMELWLIQHKPTQKDALTSREERVFEYGDLTENLLFEKLAVKTADGEKLLGGWYWREKEISDPVSGFKFDPRQTDIYYRQDEVVLVESGGHKIVGHIDGLIGSPDWEKYILVDAKSANHFSYLGLATDRFSFEPFVRDEKRPFSREYVVAQNCYSYALRQRSLKINDKSILLVVNKEKGQMMARLISYNEEFVKEGIERLTTALKDEPPEPDWDWTDGRLIPLRCEYCSFKTACADTRGYTLEERVNAKGNREWLSTKA